MSGRHGYEAPRRNDYFIPGEGISREVIQADICRYLGNDALVKPGTYNVCLRSLPMSMWCFYVLTNANRVIRVFYSMLIGILLP